MKNQYLINMLFAEELLKFLTLESNLFGFKLIWNPKFDILDIIEKTDVSVFSEEEGWTVCTIIQENEKEITERFEDFHVNCKKRGSSMDNDAVEGRNFTNWALKMAPFFFSEGYSHGAFLAYCATVIGVAYKFLNCQPNSVPKRACQVIALVLFAHQMTGQFYKERGWTGFNDTALLFLDNYYKKLEVG